MKSLRSVTGTVSSLGDNTIIPARANCKIRVQSYSLITASTTAVTAIFKSGTNLPLWTVPLQALTGTVCGANLSASGDSYLFEAEDGKLLGIQLSAAQTVTYSITFWDDEG